MEYTKSTTSITHARDFGFSILGDPTGNCQLFCIYEAENILYLSDDKKIKDMFYEVGRTVSKPLVLIDVYESYNDKIQRIFGNDVLGFTPYKSTSGSNMAIYVIRLRAY